MNPESLLPYLRPPATLQEAMRLTDLELGEINSFPRVAAAYAAPSLMSSGETVFLFGLIVARRPVRVLEIGFRYGGSSFLMLCALLDTNQGRLVSIDPQPEPALDFSRFGDRFRLIRERSPEAIPGAVEALGGAVDLCFVDGNHEYRAVLADLRGVLPHMANDSYILLHDPVSSGVARATREWLAVEHRQLVDCGLVAEPTPEGWSGLRMLRVVRG